MAVPEVLSLQLSLIWVALGATAPRLLGKLGATTTVGVALGGVVTLVVVEGATTVAVVVVVVLEPVLAVLGAVAGVVLVVVTGAQHTDSLMTQPVTLGVLLGVASAVFWVGAATVAGVLCVVAAVGCTVLLVGLDSPPPPQPVKTETSTARYMGIDVIFMKPVSGAYFEISQGVSPAYKFTAFRFIFRSVS